MSSYLLAIDQGTSSSRAILFDDQGAVKSIFQKPIELIYPQDGWVEHNPQELVDNTVWAVRSVLNACDDVSLIAGVGLTNQRETTIVWDRKTGDPVYNAIVWQDRRTAEFCERLKGDDLENIVQAKTGLLLDPYFSATKIRWILDNVDGAQARAENGDLLFGTVDTYILWHLTGRREHVTDITNASRTMLYNIIGQNWDDELLELFDIPVSMLPEVKCNVSNFGQLDESIFGVDLCVGGVAGDQQAALIGQGCLRTGMIKSTYGTGCFTLMNMGGDARLSENRLLTTIAYKVDDQVCYALEGAIFNAGTAIQFLRDNMGFFEHAHESADIARSVPDNGGVYFVPAFTGLGAPYWKAEARALVAGLSRDTTRAHIVRAALEAQGFQSRDLLDLMMKDSGVNIDVIRADGGLVSNDFMCQFLADILNVDVSIPRVVEASAWGAACLAGVQCGVFSSLEDAALRWDCVRKYEPQRDRADLDALYKGWQVAVEKSF